MEAYIESRRRIILIFILLLALTLRLYTLSSESVWLDEGYALNEAQQPTITDVITTARDHTGTPPLYVIFLHFWLNLFGTSEFALRLPSALLSTIAIVFLYLTARQLTSTKLALTSAFIMSISMTNIVYAQEIRAYGLFTFLIMLSSFFYLRFLKSNNPLNAVSYVLVTALMLYTHFLSIAIVFLQNIAYLIARDYIYSDSCPPSTKQESKHVRHLFPPLKHWFRAQAALVLLYIPGTKILLPQLGNLQRVLPGHLLGLGLPPVIAQQGIYIFVIPFIITVITVFSILSFKTAFPIRYEKLTQFTKRLFLNDSVLFAAFVLFFTEYFIFASAMTHSTFITRYTHFLYPFIYISALLAYSRLQARNLRVLIVILFLVTSTAALYTYYTDTPRKSQWREAASFIQQHADDSELIILVDKDIALPFTHYYKGSAKTLGLKTYDKETNLKLLSGSLPLLKGYSGYWLIYAHAQRDENVYKGFLDSTYLLAGETNFKGITIYHYT